MGCSLKDLAVLWWRYMRGQRVEGEGGSVFSGSGWSLVVLLAV